MQFSLNPAEPFLEEANDLHGPAIEFWKQPELNNDKRTDHEALMADRDRRRRVAKQIVSNLDDAPGKPSAETK